MKRFNPDAVLGLGNQGLLNSDCPQAIWVQSGYLVYPTSHFGKISRKALFRIILQRAILRTCLKYSQLLFCQTPVMQQYLADHFGYDMTKIKILPNALSSFLSNTQSKSSGKKPECLADGKFNCLILTQYSSYRNPEIVLQACLRAREPLDDIRFITTILEQGSAAGKHFIQRIESNERLRKLFRDVGPIPHEQLGIYYHNVQLAIIPSLMESFSTTYLEAMHFGVPILTTDLDFAHYLCGNAAAYYDPWRLESLLEELLLLKSDSQMRQTLAQAGYKQYERFSHSWNDVVKTAIYEMGRLVG